MIRQVMVIPLLFPVRAVVTAGNFNSFSCNSPWGTLFPRFPDPDSIFSGVHASCLYVHLIMIGRVMVLPLLFPVGAVITAGNFNRF